MIGSLLLDRREVMLKSECRYSLSFIVCRNFSYQTNSFSVNSINHLDERACIQLRNSIQAREVYLNIFRKIKKIMTNNSKIILLDVSRNNYFGNRNLKNPFAKSIEWFKHHEPEYWAELLSICGFKDPKITWNSAKHLRYLRIMSISKKLAYFMSSSFRLEMTLKNNR